MCVCLYVRTLREGRLSSSFFDISCSLSKPWLSPLQVPSPHCLGKRFSWLFRLNENRCLSTIEMHCDGRCTLFPPFRLTFAPQSSYYQFVMHTGNKWGISNFKWGTSQSHFRANLIAHCPCSAFEGTTFFVNNVHLIDVTIHCFAPYFLFVKQITPVNFPNWQWRMFGLPLNTLLLTLKIKMTMQKKRENRDSWIQKGWRGSAYGKILFLSIWKDWFH